MAELAVSRGQRRPTAEYEQPPIKAPNETCDGMPGKTSVNIGNSLNRFQLTALGP